MLVEVYVTKRNAVAEGVEDYGWVDVEMDPASLSEFVATLERFDRSSCKTASSYRIDRRPRVCGVDLPRYEEGIVTSENVRAYLKSLHTRCLEVLQKAREEVNQDPDKFIDPRTMEPTVHSDIPAMAEVVEDRIDQLIEEHAGTASEEVLKAENMWDLVRSRSHGRISRPKGPDDVAPIKRWTVKVDECNIHIPRERLSAEAQEEIQDMVSGVKERLKALQEEEERRQREEEQEEAQYRFDRARWITDNGSRRLRRMLAEGIECDAVYRDERLKQECPGWEWEKNVRGEGREPRNVPKEAFDLLDNARETRPDADLRYWTIEREPGEYYGDPYEDSKYIWTGYVARAYFLGDPVLYGYTPHE